MTNDRYVLITGATSGIGSSIIALLSTQYPLILHGRNQRKLDEQLDKHTYVQDPLIWLFDLKKTEGLENHLTTFIQANNAQVGAIIHCASILEMLPLKNTKIDSIYDSMSVNLVSAMLIIKTLLIRSVNKYLENIIFISSNVSNRGSKAFSVYAATKGALDSMMRCLAVELAPKIRVNSILPGAIRTEMTENIFSNGDVVDRMVKEYPLGFGEPNDIANVTEFLLSDKAKWITGQQIVVDGGRSINITG